MENKPIPFFNTNIFPEAIKFASETLSSGMISAGKKAAEFEKKLGERGLYNAVTVNSGTVTMVLALKALGVGPGDEVIIPAQTFIATGMAVLHVGAKVVFADIDPKTGNITVESIKSKITRNTKAVIVVHWAGYPCDMNEIINLCVQYSIECIEDAAHAFGSTYNKQSVGGISRFTSFSFQAIKHLTTGDGGALCCGNNEDYNHIKKLRWFGIDRDNAKESILGERVYNVDEVGYKAHMNDLAASVGLGNLLHVDEVIKHHQHIALIYDAAVKSNLRLTPMQYKSDRTSAYWIYPLLVNNRNEFIRYMKSKGVPTSVVHVGIDRNSIFGVLDHSLEGQRTFDRCQINLPVNWGISITDAEIIADHVSKF